MLVSAGAVTDGVTRFYLKSDDLFSRRPTDYRHHSHPLRLFTWSFVILVNSSTKIFKLLLGCHPLDGVTRCAP